MNLAVYFVAASVRFAQNDGSNEIDKPAWMVPGATYASGQTPDAFQVKPQ
jgi:hypothetical protein